MTQSETRHWYIATLILQSGGDKQPGPPTCEEQIRILRAADADTAYDKAMSLGKEEEHSYENVYGETVHWEFIGLEDLEQLDGPIRDGREIRGRYFRHKEPSSLIPSKEKLAVYLANPATNDREYRIISEAEPFDDDD